MSLTLNATVGAPDANSYGTVAEADTYLSYRVGASAWAAKLADEKIQALVSATDRLDQERYKGARASATQRLEWPRVGVVDAGGNAVSSAVIPQRIKNAEFELAFVYVTAPATAGDPVSPKVNDKKSIEVGDVAIEYWKPGEVGVTSLPASVQRLIEFFLYVAVVLAPEWGNSEAIRAS